MDSNRFRQLVLVMASDGVYHPLRRPSLNRWLLVALVLALVMRNASADSSSGTIRITSGNGSVIASVKAASTLPATTDPALTVTLRDSPPGTTSVQGLGTPGAPSGGPLTIQGDNSGTAVPVQTTGATVLSVIGIDAAAQTATLSTSCTATTACANTASIQLTMAGEQSAEITVTAIASPVGITVACDKSYDGGVTYLLATCGFVKSDATSTGTIKSSLANGDLAASTSWRLTWDGAPSHLRARVSALTSGNFAVVGRAVLAPGGQRVDATAVALGFPVNNAGSLIGRSVIASSSATSTTGIPLTADPTFKAVVVTPRPPEILGCYAINGNAAYTAVTANGIILSFRWGDATRIALIRKVSVGVLATAFTTAGAVERQLIVVRSFTASDTGGTALTPTGTNAALRGSFGTTLVTDIRVGGFLTAGTGTADANPMSAVPGWMAAAGNVIGNGSLVSLLDATAPTSYPLVLTQNTGFRIRLGAAEPTSTRQTWVNVEWCEANAF